MSVTATTRENTGMVKREHKFLGGYRVDLCVKKIRSNSTPQVLEKIRVGVRDQRSKITWV